MAAKKKGASKGRVKVNKLKVQRGKVEEVKDKDSKQVRGGVEPTKHFNGVISRFSAG